MSRGLLELVGSMVTVVFALPLVVAGGELIMRGNLALGAGLVSVALAMIVVDQYVTTPGDLPGLVAGKLVDAVVRPPDEE